MRDRYGTPGTESKLTAEASVVGICALAVATTLTLATEPPTALALTSVSVTHTVASTLVEPSR